MKMKSDLLVLFSRVVEALLPSFVLAFPFYRFPICRRKAVVPWILAMSGPLVYLNPFTSNLDNAVVVVLCSMTLFLMVIGFFVLTWLLPHQVTFVLHVLVTS